MCGVFGILDVRGTYDRGRIGAWTKSATSALNHRGPDGHGTWISPDGRIGLGHTRLAILDLTQAASQPMASASGSSVLSFNGEIYNFCELAGRLPVRPRTRSDSEILLEGLEEFGPRWVNLLDGMFAFGFFDQRNRELTLAVDAAGKKPLYTYWDGRIFAFASEIKAFRRISDEIHLEIAPERLLEYLAFGYVPSPETVYRHVCKVPAGHIQTVSLENGPAPSKPYWDLPLGETVTVSYAEAKSELNRLIGVAVRKRLVSDVPVGCFLSGGLDSSVIALEASQQNSGLRTFNAAFRQVEYNESENARRVAAVIGSRHHEFWIDVSTAESSIAMAHFDEPFADSSAIAFNALARATAREVKVVLSGDGADELFGGYRRLRAALLPAPPARIGRMLSTEHAATARSRTGFASRFFKAAGQSLFERLVIWNDFFSPREFREMLTVRAARVFERLAEFERATDGLSTAEKILYFNFKSYLFDDLLVKSDRMSMAHGLEVRSPFLDRDLIEYVWRLPARFKLSPWRGKIVLKDAYRRQLGTDIVDQTKLGFAFPIATMLRSANYELPNIERIFPQMKISKNSFAPGDASRMFALWSMENWISSTASSDRPSLFKEENQWSATSTI